MAYPQSKPSAFGDSFAQVAPKSTGPLHYDDIDVTDGQQMRNDAPQAAYTPATDDARAPKTKLETATGSKMNTPTVPSEGFPGIQGF
jgi:hypothetical protein